MLLEKVWRGDVEAVGLWEDETLCGVIAWRIYRATDPVLCRSDLLAVDNAHRRKGYGILLKSWVLDVARAAGAAAIASLVDSRNGAMLTLNRRLGAVIESEGDDSMCRCIIPLHKKPADDDDPIVNGDDA